MQLVSEESRKDVGRREYHFAPALNIEIPSDKSSKGITVFTINVLNLSSLSPVSDSLVFRFFSVPFLIAFRYFLPDFIYFVWHLPSLLSSQCCSEPLTPSLSLLLSLRQLLSLLPRSCSPLCCCLYPPLPPSLLLLPRSTWKLP